MPAQPSLVHLLRTSLETHGAEARQAFELFRSYVAPNLPRVPGLATVDRLAVRCANGRTPEQAAAREYLYRWSLVLDRLSSDRRQGSVFGVPHALGM